MPTSRQRRSAVQSRQVEAKPPTPKVSQLAVARSKLRPEKVAVNPFDIANLGALFPRVRGQAPDAGIAQDAALPELSSWAVAGYQQYAASEGVTFLGYPYLASLAQRAEYRKIVDVIATEMTRKWVRFVAEGEDDKTDRIKEIEAAFDRLKIRDAFRQAVEQDGFFGRAHIYISLKGDDQPNERMSAIGTGRNNATLAKVAKGTLLRFTNVEPYWVQPNPTTFNTTDPLRPDFYRPNAWNVMGQGVHDSRMLTFIGRPVPDILKPFYAYGGLSMVQMAKPYVDNWVRTRESVSDLLASFSQSGVKGIDMIDALASGNLDDLFNRIDVYNNLRDNRGFMALMGDEEFFNVSTQLGTLDKLQAQAQEQMASVSGIPLVKLLGVTPSGLNASSDGEVRVFYDMIHAYQEKIFAQPLRKALDLVMLSEFGEIDESISFLFEPLWQMSDAEKADVALKKTQALMTAEPILPTDTVLRELREMADGTGLFGQITDEDINGASTEAPSPEPEPDADKPDGAEPLPDRSDDLLPKLPQAAE